MPRPVPQRGARAIVTNAGRDAMDVESACDRRLKRTCEIVWSWRLKVGVKPVDFFHRRRCQTNPDHRGEHEVAVKTSVCGNAGMIPVDLWW